MISKTNVRRHIIIPARYGSKRFPGKVLSMIDGKTMLHRVVEIARQVPNVSNIIVATDDYRIRKECEKIGVVWEITSKDCRNGTERAAEVVRECQFIEFREHDHILIFQADLPYIPATLVECVMDSVCSGIVITAAVRIEGSPSENKNDVKLLYNYLTGESIYFSRAPIPCDGPEWFHHIGLYGMTCEMLLLYAEYEPGVFENVEGLEQLRFMERLGVHCMPLFTSDPVISINVPEDLDKLLGKTTEKIIWPDNDPVIGHVI